MLFQSHLPSRLERQFAVNLRQSQRLCSLSLCGGDLDLGLFLVGHDAFDDVRVPLLVDQELMDAAVPGSNVGKKLLEARDATVGEGGETLVGPIQDVDHPAIVDIVWIPADDLNEFEALADHSSDPVNAVNISAT